MNPKSIKPSDIRSSLLRNLFFSAIGALAISTLPASPIINDFSSITNLTPYGGSVAFDNNGGAGPLAISTNQTSPGVWGLFGGKGIFTWSQWLSLDLTEEQYFFSLTGAASTGSQAATILDIAFVIGGVGTITTGPVSTIDGNWSFDVYQAASQKFYSGSALPTGLNYQVEFYIGPISGSSGENITYELGSISATAVPEPSTILLVGAGLAVFAFSNRFRKIS